LYIRKIITPKAKVVLRETVGGEKPGTIPRRFKNKIKTNDPPRSGKYFAAFSFERKIS